MQADEAEDEESEGDAAETPGAPSGALWPRSFCQHVVGKMPTHRRHVKRAAVPWFEMPKIKAATVPEHREAQRAALLGAARELVLEGGLAALKFGDIADRAGLARPSVYEYFRTRSDLVVALVRDEAPAWRAAVSDALAGEAAPEASVRSFVRAVLELVRSGRHELPFAIAAGDLDDEARAAIGQAHAELFALLGPSLKELGVRDPGACAELVGGVISAAGNALRRDPRRRTLVDMAVDFASAGVLAMRGRARAPSGP